MNFIISKSKNSATYYIQKSFRSDADKTTAKIIEWIIEDCFRVTKTNFEARPVYLQRDDRIHAHFLTCFLALILYKYLAKKLNRGGRHFTADEIISTLQNMNFVSVPGEGYIPTSIRTELTNCLNGSVGLELTHR